jgi:hypothetical protein
MAPPTLNFEGIVPNCPGNAALLHGAANFELLRPKHGHLLVFAEGNLFLIRVITVVCATVSSVLVNS